MKLLYELVTNKRKELFVGQLARARDMRLAALLLSEHVPLRPKRCASLNSDLSASGTKLTCSRASPPHS
eukprot:2162301-Pleurochrysis_carterae.AAC.1